MKIDILIFQDLENFREGFSKYLSKRLQFCVGKF